MAQVTIKLSKSYRGDKGAAFDAVVLRKPMHRDYLDLGDPVELQPNGSGGMMSVTYETIIEKYLDRLCVQPRHTELEDIDLVDSLLLTKAVTGFFTEALKLRSELTSSSSDGGKASGTSTT